MSTLRLCLVGSLSEIQTPIDTPNLPKYIIIHDEPDEVVTIGRENSKSKVNYVLGDSSKPRVVSRLHATLKYKLEDGSFYLIDQSVNGTYVNYSRVPNDGIKLEAEDIVCFFHRNGANIKPGEKVEPFDTHLKYRVELIDEEDENINENNDDDAREDSQSRSSKEHSVKKSNKRCIDMTYDRSLSPENTVKKPKIKLHTNKSINKNNSKSGKKSRGSKATLAQDEEEVCAAGVCMRPIGLAIDWICCDKCSGWYHQMCIGISSSKTIDPSKPYFCTSCK